MVTLLPPLLQQQLYTAAAAAHSVTGSQETQSFATCVPEL
jgi:hypothetical protein